MSVDRRADMLRKIRALLAKANDSGVTDAEAEIFRNKADELITRYSVEEFELITAGRKTTAPEMRRVDIRWWLDRDAQRDQAADGNDDYRGLVYTMFTNVYAHARAIVVPSYIEYSDLTIGVAGYPGDLDYADLLFTSLLMQLERDVNPYPSQSNSYFDNLKLLREAGLSWPEVYRRMAARDCVPDEVRRAYNTASGQRDKMIRDYRKYCKLYGVPQNYNHYKTFRRNFVQGFVHRVVSRLMHMRAHAEKQTSESTGNQFALVIRDIRASVKEWLYEFDPNLRPKPPSPQMDTVAKGRRVKAYRDTRKYDYNAVAAGMAAGDRADISGHHDKRVSANPRELEQ